MPPHQVLEDYGEKVLRWLALNKEFPAAVKPLADVLNVDPSLITQANIWCYQITGDGYYNDEWPTGQYLLSQFEIMQHLETGGLDRIDVPKLVTECAKDGIEISKKRADSYELEPLRAEARGSRLADGYSLEWLGREVTPGVVYSIWLDAPTGFILKYKGRPQAVVGVAANPYEDELMVYQLQGVQGKKVNPEKKWDMHPEVGRTESKDYVVGKASSRGLAPLDWQKLMITVVERMAINLDTRTCTIQSGKNNKWANFRHNADTWHLDMMLAKKAYDEPAMRLGYKFCEADGNWKKPTGST